MYSLKYCTHLTKILPWWLNLQAQMQMVCFSQILGPRFSSKSGMISTCNLINLSIDVKSVNPSCLELLPVEDYGKKKFF